MDAKRVAEIFVRRASGAWHRASGYAIDATRVITAKHALAGAEEVRVRFLDDSELRPARVGVQSRERDVALVELVSASDFSPTTVSRYTGTSPVAWTAVGFPRASETTELGEAFRDSLQIAGSYMPLGNRKRKLLQLTVAPPPAQPELWHGLSGAAVFVHDQLAGIVVVVPPYFQGATFEGEALALVAEELGLGEVLDVAAPQPQRQVPLPQREVASLSHDRDRDRDRDREAQLHGVPSLPVNYVSRETALAPLRRNLLERPIAQHVITHAEGRQGLHAQGGIGKTVLAVALAHDPEVRQAFPDGIYWVTLGQEPNLLALQETLLVLANEKRSLESVNLGTVALRDVFRTKRCLLILDDVWHAPHLSAFDALGPHGRFLITTRDREILTQFGATSVDLELLSPEAARQLLGAWARAAPESLPDAAGDVARECGYLPLALAIVGAQVADGTKWSDVLEALREGDVRFLNHAHQSVFKSLSASVVALSEEERERYLDLAIFPEDAAVPAGVVVRLWERVGLKPYRARHLLQRFANRALLTLSGDGDNVVVTFHDLQRDYLRSVVEDASAIHRRLLSAYREDLPPAERESRRWAQLPTSEDYVWGHLFHHMLGAGDHAGVEQLVTDAHWLSTKALTSGVSALLTDLRHLVKRAPSADIRCVERALWQEAGWLHLDQRALAGLLYNRLRGEGGDPQEVERLVGGVRPRMRLAHPVRFGEGRVFRGHARQVLACAYSPDGSRILSASADCTLSEWDRATGRELARFEGHSDQVKGCAYSPDGSRILSASWDKTLREWDRSTRAELTRFDGHSAGVTACAYSPDGSRILSASWDETLREWDRATGAELTRFDGHSEAVAACAYSPDGSRVLSASWDETLREWDRATGAELTRFDGHSEAVAACAYSPDGSRILSAGADATLREWDRSTGEQLTRFDGHAAQLRGCAYSPDGSRILSAGSDATLREWDRSTGEQLTRFDGHSGGVAACAYSPEGSRILSASWDMTLREWDRSAGGQLARFDGHVVKVKACAYSPDGSRVLSGGADSSLREWDRASRQQLIRFDGHSGPISACVYSPDGSHVLSASPDQTLREWDRALGRSVARFEGGSAAVLACAYSPDGSRILSAEDFGGVREWDRARMLQLACFEGHAALVLACAYSPDGTRILSASFDQTLREWDRATGEQLTRFDGHSGAVSACAYSLDGTRILSASFDGTLREWDRSTGHELTRFEGYPDAVLAGAYSPDGSRVVSVSSGGTVRIWCRVTARCLDTLYGAAPMNCLAVTRGQFVAGDDLGNLWFVDCDWLE